MAEPIISVSGLRGIVGDSLTPLVAADWRACYNADAHPNGRAFDRLLPALVKRVRAGLTGD